MPILPNRGDCKDCRHRETGRSLPCPSNLALSLTCRQFREEQLSLRDARRGVCADYWGRPHVVPQDHQLTWYMTPGLAAAKVFQLERQFRWLPILLRARLEGVNHV